MSHEIRADYQQQYLLPKCVEDWVPSDHPARFIREYVDSLESGKLGFKIRETVDGRPNYSADLLLKVWLYGYLSRIYSLRKLERACREEMSLIWLTGNNAPDHNTLWRFFRDNKITLRKLFQVGVKVAAKANLVGMVLHAVDGTKVTAKVANRSGWHRKELEKALGRLDESIENAMEEIERVEGEEQGDYRLPKELEDRGKLRQTIMSALEEMDSIQRNHLHPDDKEARMMKGDEKKGFGYNAQVVVDSESGLIVGERVVNDENDAHQLTEMIARVQDNVGGTAGETIADGGYFSGEELHKAENEEYGVLVSIKEKEGKYHSSRFKYDAEKDVSVCPEGEELKYGRTKKAKGMQYQVRIYRCLKYKTCSCRWQCSQAKCGKTVEISPYHEAIERQREKQKDPIKLGMLKRRMEIVEHIFGEIKQTMGFRRFTVNGLEGVKTQWSLLCTVLNLKKMYRWWLEGKTAMETRVKIFTTMISVRQLENTDYKTEGLNSFMRMYNNWPQSKFRFQNSILVL